MIQAIVTSCWGYGYLMLLVIFLSHILHVMRIKDFYWLSIGHRPTQLSIEIQNINTNIVQSNWLMWSKMFTVMFYNHSTRLLEMGHIIWWPLLELLPWCPIFNTLRLRQNGCHFADDIFKRIFLNDNIWIRIKISLKFVPKGPINNIPAIIQIMAWRRPGNKPLSELMVVSLLTHICVAQPQWVNKNHITATVFDDWVPIVLIYGYPIFKWAVVTWLKDRAPV